MREGPAQLASDVQHARQTHGAQSVQTVGILHDLGFDSLRTYLGRVTVRFNGMHYASQLLWGKSQFRQLRFGLQGG